MLRNVATQRLDKIMGEVPGVPPGQTMINIVKRIDRGLEVGKADKACRCAVSCTCFLSTMGAGAWTHMQSAKLGFNTMLGSELDIDVNLSARWACGAA